MIKPAHFGFNPETASTNSFQKQPAGDIHELASKEFDAARLALVHAGFHIELFEDDRTQPLPDSIFPNNWFSTHSPSTIVIYPMMTQNRRAERKPAFISALCAEYGYTTMHNLSAWESEGKYLEGTGSMVFDHDQQIAYACISPRTDKDVLLEVCELIGYLPVVFKALDRNLKPIYHTNVMMALSERMAVCCFDSIPDEEDRNGIRHYLAKTGKTILDITSEQMESFAGNMLFIRNPKGELFVTVSDTAWNSLQNSQQQLLTSIAQPIIVSIPTIEKHGGGGIRCMLAELF